MSIPLTALNRRLSQVIRPVAGQTWRSIRQLQRPLCAIPSHRSISTTRLVNQAQAVVVTPLPSSQAEATPATTPTPTFPQVQHDVESHKTVIYWRDGQITRFHNKWLFDHCRCDSCFQSITKQRRKGLLEIPEDIHPVTLEPSPSGLQITWSTSQTHISFFPWSVLHKASYDPIMTSLSPLTQRWPVEHAATLDKNEAGVHTIPTDNFKSHHDAERILWNTSIAKSPPTVTYSSLIEDEQTSTSEEAAERGVKKLLEKVHDFGFCFITSVPTTPQETEQVIRRISPIRETHYGGFWDFTADLKMGDLAYTNEALPAHTDNTYFTDPAGLQIFHMLAHPPPGQGGTTLLVDGFYTASILSQLHPSAYETLSTLPVPTHASGSKDTLLRPHAVPVFTHDQTTNELIQVRWNNEDRGILGGQNTAYQADQVEAWYDGAMKWEEAVRSADSEYWVQLKPGMMIVIDNWRVMHGRSEFTGERRMCGAYIGRDEWVSRLNVLRRKYDQVKAEDGMGNGDAVEEAKWRDGW